MNLSKTLSSYSRVVSSLTVKSQISVEGLALLFITVIGVNSSKSELPTARDTHSEAKKMQWMPLTSSASCFSCDSSTDNKC